MLDKLVKLDNLDNYKLFDFIDIKNSLKIIPNKDLSLHENINSIKRFILYSLVILFILDKSDNLKKILMILFFLIMIFHYYINKNKEKMENISEIENNSIIDLDELDDNKEEEKNNENDENYRIFKNPRDIIDYENSRRQFSPRKELTSEDIRNFSRQLYRGKDTCSTNRYKCID